MAGTGRIGCTSGGALSELTGPRPDEIEVSLLGPGYGESVVVHMGGGEWMVVDSCTGRDGKPAALDYLDRIGVDPRSGVKMIVATHWHDDHTRGMARMVEKCLSARFCCAAALRDKELLAVVDGLVGEDRFSNEQRDDGDTCHLFALGGQENAAGLGDRQSPRVPESRLRGLVSFAR